MFSVIGRVSDPSCPSRVICGSCKSHRQCGHQSWSCTETDFQQYL